MKNNCSSVLTAWIVIALLVGGAFGAFAFPREVASETPEAKVITVTEYVNQTVEVEVPVELNLEDVRFAAWEVLLDEIGDEDDFLTCDGVEYDDDEVEVSKWYDHFASGFLDDDEPFSVFEVRLEFDDGSDERPCKERRVYLVAEEEHEDPEITLLENFPGL